MKVLELAQHLMCFLNARLFPKRDSVEKFRHNDCSDRCGNSDLCCGYHRLDAQDKEDAI